MLPADDAVKLIKETIEQNLQYKMSKRMETKSQPLMFNFPSTSHCSTIGVLCFVKQGHYKEIMYDYRTKP